MTKQQKITIEAAVQAGLEQGYSLKLYGTPNADGTRTCGSDDGYGCCLLGLLAHTMAGIPEEARSRSGDAEDTLMALGVESWSLEAGFEGWARDEVDSESYRFGAELAARYAR